MSTAAPATKRTTGTTGAKAPAAPPPRPRRTQTERREEAERRLLEAALQIVARRGAVRMTLAEVAEAAGYSRGLPTHRFGNKAGLLHALSAYIGERFGEQRARGPALQPGLDALLGNIRFYFDRAGRRGADADGAFTAMRALLVMMTESCTSPETEAARTLRAEVAGYNRSALAWFEHHIRVGLAQGEIAAGTDPQTTALVLLGAMRGVMQQALVDERIRLGPARDRLLAIARQVLQAPPSAQPKG